MILGPRDVESVNDEVSAGRLYLELDHQLDQPTLTDGQRADTRAALRKLRVKFPHAQEVARSETPDELGGLPKHLRARQRTLRDDAGLDVNAARAEREQARKRRDTPAEPKAGAAARGRGDVQARMARAARPPRGRASRTGRRRARRIIGRSTPPGATDWGRFALQSVGTAVGLSLLLLLVRDAERKGTGSAINVAAGGFAQALTRLVSPHADVFGGGAGGQAPALTMSDLAGTGVTGVPIDLTGVPSLTKNPPVLRKPATSSVASIKHGAFGLPIPVVK